MSAVEGLLWVAVVWTVFLVFAAVDVPETIARWNRGRR